MKRCVGDDVGLRYGSAIDDPRDCLEIEKPTPPQPRSLAVPGLVLGVDQSAYLL